MKDEALKLADFIEAHMIEFGLILGEVSRDHIVSTIRGLVAHIEELENPIMRAVAQAFDAPRKLSDE
jgi:Flp pilus assembly pilin Flp